MSVFPSPEEVQLRNLDRFDKIIASITSLSAIVEELRRGMAALAEVMVAKADLDDYVRAGELNSRERELREDLALRNDLDSLRSEMHAAIAEATATPFDPERPA